MTLLLTVSSFLIGSVVAIPVAAARAGRHLSLRRLATVYVTIVRAIPPIVWLFFIYFGIGEHLKGLQPVTAAIGALSLIATAYLAEIYRGGVATVEKGQWEASHALGMARSVSLRFIIGPQVVRAALPAAATYAIGLFKDTSVAYTIGVDRNHVLCQPRIAADLEGPSAVSVRGPDLPRDLRAVRVGEPAARPSLSAADGAGIVLDVWSHNFDTLLSGLWVSVRVTAVTLLIGLPAALALALCVRSPRRRLRGPGDRRDRAGPGRSGPGPAPDRVLRPPRRRHRAKCVPGDGCRACRLDRSVRQ